MGEGNLHEEQVLRRLESSGRWKMLGRAQEEVGLRIEGAPVIIRGHLDEMAAERFDPTDITTGHTRVVEVKTMSENVFRKFLAMGFELGFPAYAMQLSIYMHALGVPGLVAAKNRNTGRIVEVRFEEPPISLATITNRVYAIERMAAQEDNPAECDDAESWFCKYRSLHPSSLVEGEEPFEVPWEFCPLVDEYQALKVQQEGLEAQRVEMRKKILEVMGDHRHATVGSHDLVRRVVPQKILDRKQVKRFLTDEQFEKASYDTENEYLVINKRKDKKDAKDQEANTPAAG